MKYSTPSPAEIERCINTLEITDEREKRAIRSYWEQMREQKPGMFINWKKVGLFVLQVLCGFILTLLLLWLVLAL